MTTELSALLRDLDTALTDWVRQYAPDECGEDHVRETRERIRDNGGTLYYVAKLRERIRRTR